MRHGKLWIAVALLLPIATASAWDAAFDMGSQDSPLAEGWTRITEATVYDQSAGFGWTQPCEASFYRDKVSAKIIEGDPGAVVVDGVTNADQRTFRVDLPDGEYVVEILLGDVGGQQQWRNKIEGFPGGPVYSMLVTLNGELVASDVNAYTVADRRSPETFLGGVTNLLLDAHAADGKLLIGFHGEDSADQARLAADANRPLTAKEEQFLICHAHFQESDFITGRP